MKDKNSKNKKITIEAEMPIPLEEILEWLRELGEDRRKIFRLLECNSVKIASKIMASLYVFFDEEKASVRIEKTEHLFNDSSNIIHGTAYFKVRLNGTIEDLKKVTGFDKLLIYDWNQAK